MATRFEKSLAERALRQGLLAREQILEGVEIQKSLAARGKAVGLMKILRKKGYLTKRQVQFLQTGDGVGLDLEKEEHRQAIPGFTLARKIGRGGTSTVYLARREADGLVCAVKILFPHHERTPHMVEGFLDEGNLLARLRHPNLIEGYEAGKSKGLYYVVLEYVSGVSVKQILDAKGPLSEELAIHVLLQVARVLCYLATSGVTHRDIKPGNILLDHRGRAKICDLGFAKVPESRAEELRRGLMCGTAQYVSPEQARGAGDLDVRSDIYSLGATLYHMVVGEIPFRGSDQAQIVAKHLNKRLSTKAIRMHHVSRHMHYFLEKMMAKEREIRYAGPLELIEDVEETVEGNRELLWNPAGYGGKDPIGELVALMEGLGEGAPDAPPPAPARRETTRRRLRPDGR
ncbi:MAG: serine/threonine protein kinase [Planctomycetes bacterium]|nr:serine/threonine protein kinase [Planctomycetota bacterium]